MWSNKMQYVGGQSDAAKADSGFIDGE